MVLQYDRARHLRVAKRKLKIIALRKKQRESTNRAHLHCLLPFSSDVGMNFLATLLILQIRATN